MKQTIIPAGYRLSITSWENDGDNHQTEVLQGLSKERVEYLLAVCKLFTSGSNNNGATFGNMYEGSAYQRAGACVAIAQVMEQHRDALTDGELEMLSEIVLDEENDEYDEDTIADFGLDDIVSELLSYSECYTYRVYDGAEVEYIPHEIRMDDVTGQFEV
jgi:hypothetical protein